MVVPMIKYNGKMVPAQKDENGNWVPIENAELAYTKDGDLVVKKKSDGEMFVE